MKIIIVLLGIMLLGTNLMAKEIVPPVSTEQEPVINIEKETQPVEKLETKELKYKYKIMTTLFTRHPADNDVYNNDTNLIAGEYFFRKDIGVAGGYFDNSFYNDSYLVTLNKYFFPFDTDRFTFGLGVGIVKGYEKENTIKNSQGEVVKKSEMPTHLFDDYMIGGAISTDVWLTENLGVGIMYVGAFVGTISYRF